MSEQVGDKYGDPAHLYAAQPAPGRLTEDEIKQLILSASTDYERYTTQIIGRQRKQISTLESERDALREQLRLTHIDWQLEQASVAEMDTDISGLLDAIVWMSGSGDFGPDKPAGQFWAKYRDEIVKPAMKRYTDRHGAKPGPLIAALDAALQEGR